MRALISVSDKTGVVEFARELVSLGWELLSTSGTMRLLKEAGLPVTSVSDVTGFPEICDGRVKTLHPKIHGALLARRDIPDHMKQLEDNGIGTIDLVCVNLYPFRETIAKPDVTMEDAIEHIDIGGPSMVRSAAKNWETRPMVIPAGRHVCDFPQKPIPTPPSMTWRYRHGCVPRPAFPRNFSLNMTSASRCGTERILIRTLSSSRPLPRLHIHWPPQSSLTGKSCLTTTYKTPMRPSISSVNLRTNLSP